MRIRYLLATATLLTVLLPLSPTDSRAETATAEKTAKPSGRCSSPRAALRTFVQWQEGQRHSLARAASCMDRSQLEQPEIEAPLLAQKLKKLLDAQGLEIVLDDIPDNPNYPDTGPGEEALPHRFDLFPNVLDGVTLIKKDDRWVFSSDTVTRIPALYRAAFPLGMDDVIQNLPSWLRVRFIGIEAWQLVGVLLLVFLALLLKRIVVYVIRNYLYRLAGRLQVSWIEDVVKTSSRPIGGLVMALVFSIGFPILNFSVKLNRVAMVAIKVLAAFSAVWLGFRLIDVLSGILADKAEKTETKLDDQLVPLTRKTMKLFLSIIGGIFVLQNLNIDVGSLLAGLGLGGLAFALAAKDTIANFFGSLMIFIDKPFQIGDAVKIGSDIEGTVEEVGFRSSRIRTYYNSVITMPNARITDSSIDNLGAREFRRYKTTLGLTYDTSPEKVQAFCEGVRGIITSLPGMRKDVYVVEFTEFGAHSLDILLYCFMTAKTWNEELRTRTNLNTEILRLAAEMDVEFAFPTQSILLTTTEGSAQPGVPVKTDQLTDIVRAFGPGGRLARTNGVDLKVSFEPVSGDPESGVQRGESSD